MHRRDLLKAAGASVAALAAPRIGHAERASKLVFVPGTTASVSSPTERRLPTIPRSKSCASRAIYAAVRRSLTRAGYNGEKVVVLVPTDVQEIRAASLAGVDQLAALG